MAKRNKPKQIPDLKLTQVEQEVAESEQLKERFYELILPEEYQELRQYLRNDGFLRNDEINASLRDGRLTKEDLTEKLSALNLPTEGKNRQEKLVDYLWELHQIVQDPAVTEHIQANKLYQVETIQQINSPGSLDTERDLAQEHTKRQEMDRSLELVNGGLIANFLHNFKKAYQLDENPELTVVTKTRYEWQDVAASLEPIGLTRELLAQTGNLDRLLNGEKTGVIDFKADYSGQETTLRGKIYLVSQSGELKPYFQSVKHTLQVPDQKWGYTFSQDDKELLKQKGELGKQVELEDRHTGKKYAAYVGVDQETNSLTVWRADRVHIPVQIKGVTLSKEQQETLQQGGAVRLTGLTSENGQKFDADVQVSASKRGFIFSPPSEAIKQTIDLKTAKEMERSSDQLQGASVDGATLKARLTKQELKKAEERIKEIGPEKTKSVGKAQSKNKKDQSLQV